MKLRIMEMTSSMKSSAMLSPLKYVRVPVPFSDQRQFCANHITLEINIVIKNFFERHDLWLSVRQCEHNHTDRFLHLAVAIKLI